MNDIFLDLIECTNKAMLYELFTSPKFGCVTPYTQGAHSDMDHYTFVDSLSVLNKYMFHFATLGYREGVITSFYDEAVQIGLACEVEMFRKTNGVNTHKGLIFVLGTLVCSTAKCLYEHFPFEDIFTLSQALIQNKLQELVANHDRTHGQQIYQNYGIGGVRSEAANGFPSVKKALPYVHLDDKRTFMDALLVIMSECEDTVLIHRSSLEDYRLIQCRMKAFLQKGYNSEEMQVLETEFIQKGWSPGGAADLLCATLYLALIRKQFYKIGE